MSFQPPSCRLQDELKAQRLTAILPSQLNPDGFTRTLSQVSHACHGLLSDIQKKALLTENVSIEYDVHQDVTRIHFEKHKSLAHYAKRIWDLCIGALCLAVAWKLFLLT